MAVEELSIDVLLIEDNPGDAKLVEHHLNAPHVADFVGDVSLERVDSLTAGLEALESGHYDILFLDLGLPESTGLETLERAVAETAGIPIIVLTGLEDRETAVQSIQRGAQDYLFKTDIDPDTLARSLRYGVERYRQEAELRRQNERLEQFASVVSHDLRNPLTVAKGRIDIEREIHGSEHLDVAADSIERSFELIEDLLALARGGQDVSDTERVAVADLVEECWSTVDTNGAAIETDIEATVTADRSRLRQLFENLFRNSIEHGGHDVTVEVGSLPDGFYVADTGRGIPVEHRDRVFEEGYSESQDGTGFGLSIIEQIVGAHDWDIRIADNADRGVRFEITGVEMAAE